jgi:hypothetical protein
MALDMTNSIYGRNLNSKPDFKDTYLYCWASGLAQFGDSVPDGAILIDSRTEKQLEAEAVEIAVMTKKANDDPEGNPMPRNSWKERMTARMRIGYKGEMLVPGVPEAADQSEGVEALIKFIKWAVDRAK